MNLPDAVVLAFLTFALGYSFGCERKNRPTPPSAPHEERSTLKP